MQGWLASALCSRLTARGRRGSRCAREVFRLLLMVSVGYSEEARAAAQTVVLPRGGPGQNDVTSPSFLAASQERSAGDFSARRWQCLPAAACSRLGTHQPHSRLAAVHEDCRAVTAALSDGRAVGRELDALAGRFRERLVPADGQGSTPDVSVIPHTRASHGRIIAARRSVVLRHGACADTTHWCTSKDVG